jgi:hypothetical protein
MHILLPAVSSNGHATVQYVQRLRQNMKQKRTTNPFRHSIVVVVAVIDTVLCETLLKTVGTRRNHTQYFLINYQ